MQYNGQKKKDKHKDSDYDLQDSTQKTKDKATRIQLKQRVNPGAFSGREAVSAPRVIIIKTKVLLPPSGIDDHSRLLLFC